MKVPHFEEIQPAMDRKLALAAWVSGIAIPEWLAKR
jgi:hypothetical protein